MKNSIFTLKHFAILIIVLLTTSLTFAQEAEAKKEKKKKDEFKVLVGGTLNSIPNSSAYEASSDLGYIIGAKYKRGRFFYWELGARYNRANYTLNPKDGDYETEDNIGVSSLDIPINVGINLLSVTERILGLRIFIGAVPTFVLSSPDNNFNITKDNLNSFMMYGQAGLGVDIAFFFIEAGINYGFSDVIKADTSKPYQGFVNLGFRF